MEFPSRIVILPTGIVAIPTGKKAIPVGIMAIPAGKTTIPTGIMPFPVGKGAIPAGKVTIPAGNMALPAGNEAIPIGTGTIPAGSKAIPTGKTVIPHGCKPLDRLVGREKLRQLLMFAASDPNMIIAGFGVGGLVFAVFWRFIVWIRDAPVTPDPWDAEVEQKLSEPETPEVCPHCSAPQSPTAWFCPHCGRAVGPYNNLMPFVQVFSEGEVFRNGTSGRFRNRPLILIGYFLMTVGTFPVLAPIYLLSLLLNWKHPPGGPETASGQNVQR